MKIDFVEVKYFRKLEGCRIELDPKMTLLVGANNSGKTSAMTALRKFLISSNSLEFRDISISNWPLIDELGMSWENDGEVDYTFNELLPVMDIWLDVPLNEIHHMVHILPSADWSGGAIGVRLQFEVKNIEALKTTYLEKREAARKIEEEAPKDQKPEMEPKNLVAFLDGELFKYITLKAYSLDPELLCPASDIGQASLQTLPDDALEIEGAPFQDLINIREIPAERNFTSAGSASSEVEDSKAGRVVKTLSDHVRSYYDTHIDQTEEVNADDINAFSAIQKAEKAFDARLKTSFLDVFDELKDLGVPGINNPNIVINTKFKSLDGLSHGTAVQYKVSEPEDGHEERYLPESYAGLGYQNLIAMIFLLMRFRQDWIEPRKRALEEINIAPLQLVMIEEPEAHLHAQVQQVFIKKAYSVLRNHEDLGELDTFNTQILVSTHSSHVAHEVDFANLRYFRRHQASANGKSPVSTVINLSHIFGEDNDTLRFVKRYIKATDCDLFFADAAIFVEGQAERILVPHLIRHHYSELWRRYISVIDLGGSNAPRFRPLLKALGLTSLVITDLDAGKKTQVPTAKGGTTTRTKKAKPSLDQGQVTTNPTLKGWHPNLESIDELIKLKDEDHAAVSDDQCDLYVAYQKQVKDPTGGDEDKLIPRTFEDAFVYENYDLLSGISGSSTSNKISGLVESELKGEDLESELFEIIDSAEKAAFAIDCLIAIEDGAKMLPPAYISNGLEWLETKLREQSLSFDDVGA